jgi:predicted enzyme related to lactoylglutathione lyase
MIKVREIAFSGYPVTDLKRARGFYEGLLGLKVANTFGEGEQMWIEYDIAGATLAITNMAGAQWKPSADGGSVALEVEDFDDAVRQIKEAGVPITMGPYESPVCWMVLVTDPDGNGLCIHRRHDHAA